MPLGIAFWVLMIVWFVFGLALHFGVVAATWGVGNTLLLFVLFAILGWQVFGPVVHR